MQNGPGSKSFLPQFQQTEIKHPQVSKKLLEYLVTALNDVPLRYGQIDSIKLNGNEMTLMGTTPAGCVELNLRSRWFNTETGQLDAPDRVASLPVNSLLDYVIENYLLPDLIKSSRYDSKDHPSGVSPQQSFDMFVKKYQEMVQAIEDGIPENDALEVKRLANMQLLSKVQYSAIADTNIPSHQQKTLYINLLASLHGHSEFEQVLNSQSQASLTRFVSSASRVQNPDTREKLVSAVQAFISAEKGNSITSKNKV